MSRASIILRTQADRERAVRWAKMVPAGTRVEFKQVKRSLPQNDRFWAMLTDVATHLTWHGVKLTTADWKLIFLAALKKEMRVAPSIDGTGFVNLGTSSSDLSKEEMSNLIDLVAAFGAQRGVVFGDEGEEAA